MTTSRRIEQVEKSSAEIEALGCRTLRVTSDVTNRVSLQAMHDAVLAEFGKVDILVNAAGVTHKAETLKVSEADWSRVIENQPDWHSAHLPDFRPDHGCRRLWTHRERRLLSTYVGFADVAAYCASKAGITSLTKVLAIELAQTGVNVNAIAPGVFPTELNARLVSGTPRGEELLLRTPMGRFGKPHELARLQQCFWHLEAASFITGEVIAVDGGFLASGVKSIAPQASKL